MGVKTVLRWPHSLRFWLLVVALLGLLATFVMPRFERPSERYKTVLVVDITRSMNVRDYTVAGQTLSRLDFIKAGIRELLLNMPCQSELGLAIFTSRQAFLLFEPLEVCGNFAAIMATVEALNWRMAWQGDSGIAYGLNSAFSLAQALAADLIFLTDGQEAPPPPRRGPPRFRGQAGSVTGLIGGIGGHQPMPIPKYDQDGREIGFLSASDVPHESRLGMPPANAQQRPGWHPRNAPWGGSMQAGTEHLSAVREDYLRQRADLMGFSYAHLDSVAALRDGLLAVLTPHPTTVLVDWRWLPAVIALLCLILIYYVDSLTPYRVKTN